MEKITTVGIDLAKNVFSLHGVDANGKVVLKRTVRRGQVAEAVASLPPCVIGIGPLTAVGVQLSSGPEQPHARKQAGYSDAVRPFNINSLAATGKSL